MIIVLTLEFVQFSADAFGQRRSSQHQKSNLKQDNKLILLIEYNFPAFSPSICMILYWTASNEANIMIQLMDTSANLDAKPRLEGPQ